MFKRFFTTKRICRAGIIAALYVALTYAFGALSFQSILQIRPAEALCILPLFFPEAVPALYIGCMLANIVSPYWIYDVFVGSLATLAAAACTCMIGYLIRETAKAGGQVLRVALGGLFPVLVNAFVIPLIIVFCCDGAVGFSSISAAYWTSFLSLLATESLWVYALGVPLYLFVLRMRKRGYSPFLDGKKLPQTEATAERKA